MEKLFPGSGQSCFPKTSQLWTPEYLLVPFSPLFLLLSQNTGPPTPSLRFWGKRLPAGLSREPLEVEHSCPLVVS